LNLARGLEIVKVRRYAPMGRVLEIREMAELPAEELRSILRQGAILRLPYLEGRLLQAREQIRRFEEKYKTKLDTFKSQGLPENAGYEMHEDFIEWEYWDDVLRETETAVKAIKALLKKVE